MKKITLKNWSPTLPELFIIIFVVMYAMSSSLFERIWNWVWNWNSWMILGGLIIWAAIERIREPHTDEEEEDDWDV